MSGERTKGQEYPAVARRYVVAQRAWSYHLRKPLQNEEEHQRLWREYKAAEAEFNSPAPAWQPVALSYQTRRLLDSLFAVELQGQAADLLELHCGRGIVHKRDGDLSEKELGLIEHIRYWVLRRCDGSLERLAKLVEVAEEDWREVAWWEPVDEGEAP
jgi:hypothetical protein